MVLMFHTLKHGYLIIIIQLQVMVRFTQMTEEDSYQPF